MRMKKKQLLYLIENKMIFVSVSVFLVFFGVVLLMGKVTYSVDSDMDMFVINCPDTINSNEIECLIEINSVTMVTQGVSANFLVADGIGFDSFVPNSEWNDYINNEDGFVLVSKNDTGISGHNVIGKVKFNILGDIISNNIYKIGLKNASMGDGDVGIVEFDNVYDEVRIISSINTLDNISLSNGSINEEFDKNKSEYTANVDSDKVIIEVVKSDENSVIGGDVGEVELHYGTNIINIDVTSENGVKNRYSIRIFREYEFNSDKYVYLDDIDKLYTFNDVSDDIILSNIVLEDGLNKKIEDNKLIISYIDEVILELEILNISFKDYIIDNKDIIMYGEVSLSEFIDNMKMYNELSYKIIDGEEIFDSDEILVDDMKLKIYYNDRELDSYNIKIESFAFSIDKSINVDDDNKYINYIDGNTNVYDLIGKVKVIGGSVKLIDTDNNEKNNDLLVATGDKLVIYKGDKVEEKYEISVFGDANGDGEIGLVDLVQIRKYIAGNDKGVDGVYYNAIDLNKDSNVGLVDLVRMRKIIARIDVDE